MPALPQTGGAAAAEATVSARVLAINKVLS